jgi:acyl-CoA synthetase (NDP forming)
VAIVGNAGGPGILATDAAEGAGLEAPELSALTQTELRSFLPGAAAVRNPVDLIASASADDYERALRAVLADDGVDAVIVIFIPPLVTQPDDVARAIATAAAGATKPVLAGFLAMEGTPQALRAGPRAIPSFRYPESAAHALAHAVTYTRWRQRPEGAVPTFGDVYLSSRWSKAQMSRRGIAPVPDPAPCGVAYPPSPSLVSLKEGPPARPDGHRRAVRRGRRHRRLH